MDVSNAVPKGSDLNPTLTSVRVPIESEAHPITELWPVLESDDVEQILWPRSWHLAANILQYYSTISGQGTRPLNMQSDPYTRPCIFLSGLTRWGYPVGKACAIFGFCKSFFASRFFRFPDFVQANIFVVPFLSTVNTKLSS